MINSPRADSCNRDSNRTGRKVVGNFVDLFRSHSKSNVQNNSHDVKIVEHESVNLEKINEQQRLDDDHQGFVVV